MNCSSAARATLLLLMAAAATADETFSLPIVDKIRKLLHDGSEDAIDESSLEHGKAQGFEEVGPKVLYFMGIPLATDEVSGAAKVEGKNEGQEDAAEPAAVVPHAEIKEEGAKSPEHKSKAPRFNKGVPLATDQVSGAVKAEGEKEEKEDAAEPAAVVGIEVSQEDETTVTCHIGQGWCADRNGDGFSLLKIDRPEQPSLWTIDACMRVCTSTSKMIFFPLWHFLGQTGLAGIELKTSADDRDPGNTEHMHNPPYYDQCFCRFLNLLGTCHNSDVCWNPNTRPVGPVAGVRPAAGWDCYATVPDEECPNGQECLPVPMPTERNNRNRSVGANPCLDANGQLYNWQRTSRTTVPDNLGVRRPRNDPNSFRRSECANACRDLSDGCGIPILRGFELWWFHNGEGSTRGEYECRCLYDSDVGMPNEQSLTPSNSQLGNADRGEGLPGTGPIDHVGDYTQTRGYYANCYKLV